MHNNSYHLATFNTRLTYDQSTSSKIIREEEYIKDIKEPQHENIHDFMKAEKIKGKSTFDKKLDDGQIVELKKVQEQQTRFVFEEKDVQGQPQVFYGRDSTEYSGDIFKSKQNRQFLQTNDFTTANYAFMVYDEQLKGFRLLPVQRHLQFLRDKKIQERKPFQSRVTAST